MKDNVNHPEHYGGVQNMYEPIKIIDYYKLNFHLGNAIKYILRHDKKGNALEDLKKAQFYISHQIKLLENGSIE